MNNFSTNNLQTTFGNISTFMALSTPLFYVYGNDNNNLKEKLDFLYSCALLTLLISPIFYLFNAPLFTYDEVLLINLIFIVIPYKNKLQKYLSFFCVFNYILYCFFELNIRTTLLRIVLFFFLKFITFNNSRKANISIIIFSYSIIIYLLFITVNGDSFVNIILNYFDSLTATDTRTFLFRDVILDLENNNSMMLGKGVSSKYFSEYFFYNSGDSYQRFDIEVGALALLLKGGLILLSLHIGIYMYTYTKSIIESTNIFCRNIGIFLIAHSFIIFIENRILFNLYNIILFFFIGIILNEKYLKMSDHDIKDLIK